MCSGGDILKRKYWRGEEGFSFFLNGGGGGGGGLLKGSAGEGRRVFYFWQVVGENVTCSSHLLYQTLPHMEQV